MRSQRKRKRVGRNAGALGASVIVHVALGGALLALHRPRPRPVADLELVEVTLLQPGAIPSDPDPDTGSGSDPASEAVDRPDPATARTSGAEPLPVAPRGRSAMPRSEPASESESPDSDAGGASSQRAGGLSLTGLRRSSHAGAAMVPRPKLSPPTAGPASRPSPRPEPSLGTVEPSADGPDRTPRSLAEAGFRPHADGTYRYRSPGYPFKATLHPNGRVEFHLKVSQAHRVGLPEIVRAANGREIYVRAKKRLLQQTFELRLNLAVSWAREQMDSQLRSLYRQLMLTWKHPGWTPARRRLELFTLWDDCEESLTLDLQGIEDAMLSKIDAQRQSAGKKARRKIIEFIGRHLAKGSEHAYSDLELQELNAKRRSAERFAPYAG